MVDIHVMISWRLTSIAWLYRGLKCTPYSGDVFFLSYLLTIQTFSLIAGSGTKFLIIKETVCLGRSHRKVRFSSVNTTSNRPIQRTQFCTQIKSPGVKTLCVLYLHYDVAFTFLNEMEIPETKRFIPKGFELGTILS